MKFDSSVWPMLMLSLLVVLVSVSSFPATAEDAEESAVAISGRPVVRKHSKTNKEIYRKKKSKVSEQRHHSTRGLKEMTDYDYAAAMAEPAVTGSQVRKNKIKDDRSPWSPKRRNKKANRKNKRNNGKNKKQPNNKKQVLRTTRRAGSFDDDDLDAGQLLGLGVFGDMRKFFDDLRNNLDADAVAAEAAAAVAERLRDPKQRGTSSSAFDDLSQITGLVEDYEELPNFQALRTTPGSEGSNSSPVQQQRRYSSLKGFVAMGGPGSPSSRHHRNHPYDPALLWTGLGRRR